MRGHSTDAESEEPTEESSDEQAEKSTAESGLWARFWGNDRGGLAFAREVLLSLVIVALIAGTLFAMSGVWPPLVAVESSSMEDQIMTGDLVFIVDAERFSDGNAIDDTGVVPADVAAVHGYERFDRPGDVIIFAPSGDGARTPIIHRAHLWVEADEDWYDRADTNLVGGADNCEQLTHCPAPHAGFVTHGDNNNHYDQVQHDTPPVKEEWVLARAHLRIPLLGYLRLVIQDTMGVISPAPVLVP